MAAPGLEQAARQAAARLRQPARPGIARRGALARRRGRAAAPTHHQQHDRQQDQQGGAGRRQRHEVLLTLHRGDQLMATEITLETPGSCMVTP